ncbi:glycosyltransferase family 39 protein [Thermodesulfatator atlanticus]
MKNFFSWLFSAGGLVLLVLLGGKITFLQQIWLNLSPDEAYYWDWSRVLDWGYYSKPPMVAWIIHLSSHVIGHSEYGVRVPAAFLNAAFLAFVYYLGRRLFDEKVGFWAMIAAAASPIAAVYGFVMTIDPPLFAIWALALCLAWNAVETQKTQDFIILGVVIGLGLLTKQTMVAFLFCFFLWLWLTQKSLFYTIKPYLAALIAFIIYLPNLIWNAKHGWITFLHTSHHFEEQRFNLEGPLRFLVEQAVVITPITLFLILFVFSLFVKREKLRQNEKISFLFVFSAVPLGLVLPLSFIREVNANWPYPFYIAAFVMLSALILRGAWKPAQKRLMRGLFFAGIFLGMVVMLATYQLARTPEKFPPKIQMLLYKFSGWSAFAKEVQSLRQDGEIIITVRRDFASEMAFYLPDHPRTFTFWQGYIKSQYDLWDGLPSQIGKNAILLLNNKEEGKKFAACFENIEFLNTFEQNNFGRKRKAAIFRGYSLKACPYLARPK